MDEPAENNYGFTYLMDMERQGLTCTRVDVIIDRYCDCNETWIEGWYKGYLRLNAGEWEVSGCKVTIPVVVQDPFTCLTSTWTDDVNMFDYGDPPVEATPFAGVIQKLSCTSDVIVHDFYPPSYNTATSWVNNYVWQHLQTHCLFDVAPGAVNHPWTLIKHTHITALTIIQTPPPVHLRAHIRIRSQWGREFVAGATEPDGLGWVEVTGGWARPLNVVDGPFLDQTTPEGIEAIETEWFPLANPDLGFVKHWTIVGQDQNGNSIFTNGKELGPLLIDLLEPCGLTVVSNFYNINPDGSNPDNDYYTRAQDDFHGIVLYQVTDIARLDETQSATIAYIKVKELLDAMKVAGNCDISLDGTIVRIEHLSYWPKNVQMDLTQDEFYYLIKDKWKYTYDQEAQAKREIIAWGVETDGKGGDFDGFPIEYDNACVNDQEDKSDKEYRATNYVTNILKVTGNEDFYDDTETIVMVSTKNLIVQSATQPISGFYKLNGNLAMGYLIPRYYDYSRPYKEGYINKTLTPLYQSLYLKLQAPITIPMQCEDYLNNYSADGLIKTQLGACIIDIGTYTDPDGTLEVKLRAK